MSTTDTGQQAEAAAAEYLTSKGFKVLERNFRTSRCEIDIIAQKDNCVYFVEVKYRVRSAQGAGLDYVTAKKQKQMRLAAEIWTAEHDWTDEMVLTAIEVSGPDFRVGEFVESIY